jgi:hypothetical protein
VVAESENTKSSVSIRFSTSCGLSPDEPVSLDFRAFSTRSPQLIHRVLHSAFLCDSSEYPPIFRTFYTAFSSTIAVRIPLTISAAFSHAFRRKNGRKQGGDPKSAETAENRFRKAGWAGITRNREEQCTENVARGTFMKSVAGRDGRRLRAGCPRSG